MTSLESLFIETLHQRTIWVVALAFLGGVTSSVLPCTIAMLPVLVGYVGGFTHDSKKEVFFQVLLFILGLSLVMTILGIAASLLGVTFGALIGSGTYYVIGILSILMALQLLNVIHIPWPRFVHKLPESNTGKILAPLMLGITFGIASSPCGTPFLAAILAFISNEKNIALGGASLFFYALGQGTLLLFVGLFTGLLKHMAILRHVGRVITILSGILFLVVGIMLIAQGAGMLAPILSFLRLL